MSTQKQGVLTRNHEYAKHFRPWLRRMFWGKERQAGKRLIRRELTTTA